MSGFDGIEKRFGRACEVLLGELAAGESLSIEFSGEASTFMRFNRAVRQIGEVDRSTVSFKYYRDGRTLSSGYEATGDGEFDAAAASAALSSARREAALLPEDPYQTLPAAAGSSREEFPGRLPDPGRLGEAILAPAKTFADAGADFVGIHSQGPVCRGAANDKGARHWFATETFAVDWSAYLPGGKALKSCFAGRVWDQGEYERALASKKPRLEALAKPERSIAPGEYRVWIASDALNEFVPFFSWNGLSERKIREGESAFIALKEGRRLMSPKFSLSQDFSLGMEPRFNEQGELAPERLELISRGELANSLVSARSARQYQVASNAAPEWEGLRSASIAAGELDEDAAGEAVGTGLLISNLHYLNWSDFDSARVTGMTRFACFWVEGGRIAAPIEDMRFDESLYRLFGDKLLGLGRSRSLVSETSTYDQRALGGSLLPGILVDGFTLTL
jgi:predicted Zn-dependent protease